ncbi:LOW QUALITY PROTEIN: hypothetical protein V1477_018949 [Vespula maculifrons]|uniref:Uncharacterized protein n=1 Tax=Vespula maculifrons TaxID=7453 RepID=A0ABD2ASX5_VESMC
MIYKEVAQAIIANNGLYTPGLENKHYWFLEISSEQISYCIFVTLYDGGTLISANQSSSSCSLCGNTSHWLRGNSFREIRICSRIT